MPKSPESEGVPRLMTISEIAEEHGVSRQSVHSYRTRGTFPKPVEGEGSTRPRFRADEVAAWFAVNPPRPGKRTDLATRDEGASVETTDIAIPPGVALEAAREFVQWLGAQFDEDAVRATAAAEEDGPDWHYDGRAVLTRREGDLVAVGSQDFMGPERGQHIAEHDPAQVLREIDAKRRILNLYATAVEERSALRARMRQVINSDPDEFGRLHMQESELIKTAEYLAPVAHLLALPYADRPGYREDWRP